MSNAELPDEPAFGRLCTPAEELEVNKTVCELLLGHTTEELVAMGNEIFDVPQEEEAPADKQAEPGASVARTPGGRGWAQVRELLKEREQAQEQGAKDCLKAGGGKEEDQAAPPSPLDDALRPSVIAQLQDACDQALGGEQLTLLKMAMDGMGTVPEPEACTVSNESFVKALEEAIENAAVGYYVKSPLESQGCQAVQRMLSLALGAAAQRSREPQVRSWCDLRKLFADSERLAERKNKSDEEKAYHDLLSRLLMRPLLRRPAHTPRAQAVLDLVRTMPNFAEPITHVAEQLALHRMRQGLAFQPAPMLLLGPPGVGKSHFAQALARMLGSAVHTLQLASQSNGWALGGLDRSWSGAKTGQVFEALANGDTLAPVVVLDEIDKVNSDSRNHPLGPLYALLEPVTASKFRDEFVEFTVDASQVIWIATANDEHAIPPALLSRFVVFRIEAPSGDELAAVMQTMYREAAAGIPGAPEQMPLSWQTACRGLSLRASRIAIGKALGRAVLRAELKGQETVELLANDLDDSKPDRRPRMGFGLH